MSPCLLRRLPAFGFTVGLLGSACVHRAAPPHADAHSGAPTTPSADVPSPRPPAMAVAPRPEPPNGQIRSNDPIGAGLQPWWAHLETATYELHRVGEAHTVWELAVGRSTGHHHPVEGVLAAKVAARLMLAPESADAPELVLLDLFMTSNRTLLALVGRPRSKPAHPVERTLQAPLSIIAKGPHRVGPHRFHDDQHVFLECEVEGPLANPSWGPQQVLARLGYQETP